MRRRTGRQVHKICAKFASDCHGRLCRGDTFVSYGSSSRAPAAVLEKTTKGDSRVMFLFRIVFWLGLAVLLLPTEENQQAKLYDTASATVERIATFCDRNPKTCAAGAEFWSTFLKKAEFGARGPAQTAAPRPSGAATVEPRPASAPRNTPSRDDLGPAWRASAPRAGA